MAIDFDPVAQSIREVYPYRVDLENCDVEPLRHIQVVQAHACLLAVEVATLIVRHVSENAEAFIGIPWQEALDRPLRDFLSATVLGQIPLGLEREQGFTTINPIVTAMPHGEPNELFNVIIHRSSDAFLLVEVEHTDRDVQASQYQQLVARSVHRIQNIAEPDQLFVQTVSVLKQVSGYDRVMVYRFDKDYNGEVIAEARNEDLEPYEGLRYPHTDIPKQARELYLTNKVRLIGSVTTPPARIHRSEQVADPAPLDLTHAACRGVSPVHLEYLGYMGVDNSLSIAIILQDRLWGLFAFHHYSPRTVDYSVRSALLFIGQIFSGHLSLQATNRYREQTLTRKLARLAIGEQITKTRDIFEGLSSGSYSLLTMFPNVSSAVINFEGRMECYGNCPTKDDVTNLLEWVATQVTEQDLYYENDSVGTIFEPFSCYCDANAGALIVFLNPSHSNYLCWFRPGLTQQITWGGKPEKNVVVSGDGQRRLGPRQSFARYVETVEGCSAPWTETEIDAALALRITVINGLLQRYSEVQEINERLQKAYEDLETFSYTVSHDLRAPLRAINGYTEILVEDYGKELNEDARGLIRGIQRGVDQMNSFITDILDLSRVGSSGLQIESIAVAPLVQDILVELNLIYQRSGTVSITYDEQLPPARADRRLLRQLYTNLLSNALKYIEPNENGQLLIHIGAYQDQEVPVPVFTVSNTGPAIPEEFRRTIFEMFSRLSTGSTSEGTGVGLAIVERIVDRHHGRVWVDEQQLGITFHFYLNPGNAQ